MTILILTLVELPSIGEKYAGVASGFFFSAAEIGGVLGPVSMGMLYDISDGFVSSLVLLSVIASLTAIGAFHQTTSRHLSNELRLLRLEMNLAGNT